MKTLFFLYKHTNPFVKINTLISLIFFGFHFLTNKPLYSTQIVLWTFLFFYWMLVGTVYLYLELFGDCYYEITYVITDGELKFSNITMTHKGTKKYLTHPEIFHRIKSDYPGLSPQHLELLSIQRKSKYDLYLAGLYPLIT